MKDKRGATSALLIVGVIAMVTILGFLAYNQFSQNVGGDAELGTLCEIEPYIDNSTFNEYAKGTGVAVSFYYIANEEGSAKTLTTGSSGTKFNVGDKLKILTSASGYLDTVEDFTITKCGANERTNYVYQGDAITMTILDQNYNTLGDSATGGGALNQSSSANPINLVVRLDGASDKATGQVLLTVEVNDTMVSDASISAKSAGARVIESNPNTYANLKLFSAEGTAPTLKQAFVVDSISDGGQADYNIRLTPESGKTIGSVITPVYFNAYAGEWFIDDNGKFKFGWETTDVGTAKYEQKATDYDITIV